MNLPSPRSRVAGADAARIDKLKGWAVVLLEDGRPTVEFFLDLQPLVASTQLVAVDIPIGLPGDGGIALDDLGRRHADGEARDLVASRRDSVFWAPPRAALDQPNYAEARRLIPSLSSQAYHLGPRILEVAALVEYGAPVVEFHPELSFRALNRRTLDYPKKSWNGQQERRRILKDAGLELPAKLDGDAGLLAVDDVFDAAVGAVTAKEVATAQGLAIGRNENTGWKDRGVIWCPTWT